MTGDALKKHRQNLGYSQEELARALEVAVSTAARWEQLKDKEIPNSKMLELALKTIKSKKI